MPVSSFKSIHEYKSRLSVAFGVVFRSRENQVSKLDEAIRQRDHAREEVAALKKRSNGSNAHSTFCKIRTTSSSRKPSSLRRTSICQRILRFRTMPTAQG